MDFSKCNLKKSYRSYGKDPIVKNIIPLLAGAKTYKRAVGFFSSSVFKITEKYLIEMLRNKGEIQLITSPILSKEDIEAIKLGEKLKEKVLETNFILEFEEALNSIEGNHQKMIMELIAKDKFKIKIVTTKGLGQYHDKLGIIEDHYGNTVVFTGSSNESYNGLLQNYEKIRLDFSWDYSVNEVEEELMEFEELWNGTNPDIETHSFPEAINKAIIKIRENNELNEVSQLIKQDIKPRSYQKEAINAWINNKYNGFYVMATGTGKTFTALFSLKELLKIESDLFTVIAVPYKHLVNQWMEDVEVLFPNTKKFIVMGESKDWDQKIKTELLNFKLVKSEPIIIVSTIDSFYGARFASVLKLNKAKRLLIVDEAHNFLNKIEDKKFDIDYEYKIGLSATPVFGKIVEKTTTLLNFFGGEVFKLPIEDAIKNSHLVKYNYYPIYIDATEDDEKEFKKQQSLIQQCYDKNGKIKDLQKFSMAYRGKLRAISMAENKILNISQIIKDINVDDHFIIYCSDGRVDEDDMSIRHLNKVVKTLVEQGYSPGQFTSTESSGQRIDLINHFNDGNLSTLVAIKCLDEGINIPSIQSALILSSNDNYREFVQRRGRILRKYKDKKIANIYDLVVLPSMNCIEIAKIEFRRVMEYAKLADNFNSIETGILAKMESYGLTSEDVKFENEYIEEVEIDE